VKRAALIIAALSLCSVADARRTVSDEAERLAAKVKQAKERPQKVFHLYINDGEWELADGKKTYIVSYVAYNDKFEEMPKDGKLPPPQIPAPTIRVKLGDDVFVTLHNTGHHHLEKDSGFQGVPHTIHFHGMDLVQAYDGVPGVPHAEVPEKILPGIPVGESYTYHFVPQYEFGMMRVINLAHGEFLMLGMYGAWALSTVAGLNPYTAALVVVPAMLLFGGLVHRLIISPALDKPHLVVVFATMGLSIFMQNVALMIMTADLWDVPPVFSRSLVIGPFYFKPELLLGFVITIVCTLALRWMIQATYLGKAIRATVQDSEAAMLMGIPVPRIFLITFAGGSALVGLSACVMMPLFSVFPTVGLNFVLIAFVIVVLGGMGSIGGALLGGIIIGIVQSYTVGYASSSLSDAVMYLLMALILLVRPRGLMGRKGVMET